MGGKNQKQEVLNPVKLFSRSNKMESTEYMLLMLATRQALLSFLFLLKAGKMVLVNDN